MDTGWTTSIIYSTCMENLKRWSIIKPIPTQERIVELMPWTPIIKAVICPKPAFVWGEVDGEGFVKSIDTCYKEVVQWRRNLFRVPSGKAGKGVRIMQRSPNLLTVYVDGSTLECIVLKAVLVMPSLLLRRMRSQKKTLPCWRSGGKETSTPLYMRYISVLGQLAETEGEIKDARPTALIKGKVLPLGRSSTK